MEKNARCTVVGFGNKTIICQGGSKNVPLQIDDILSNLLKIFNEEDEEINSIIPDGVTMAKVGEKSPFCSEKILLSLLKIGMPLELSIYTLETVLKDILDLVHANKTLCTKEIRRIVSDAIRRMEGVSKNDSDEWSYRYTRKYGHDNRQVQIYNCPDGTAKMVSYSIISTIVKDAFRKIIPSEAVEAIPRAQMDQISEQIVEFINGCDLYYFDYDLLVNMIIELSRQPPHPWIITKDTRESIKEYDIQAINSNINKLNTNTSIKEGETYCYTEIIHHASSLLLQKYQWFLGAKDLSSFHILKILINKYVNTELNDLLDDHPVARMEKDLVLAGHTINEFQAMLNNIEYMLNSRKYPSDENRALTIKYGQLAIDVISNDSLNNILQFIKSNWEKQNCSDILHVITKIMNLLSHASDNDNSQLTHLTDYMLKFNYKPVTISDYTLKQQYIILYYDKSFPLDSLSILNNRNVSSFVDVVIVVSEHNVLDTDFINYANSITNDKFWFVYMNKNDLSNIVTSDSPYNCFYNTLSSVIG